MAFLYIVDFGMTQSEIMAGPVRLNRAGGSSVAPGGLMAIPHLPGMMTDLRKDAAIITSQLKNSHLEHVMSQLYNPNVLHDDSYWFLLFGAWALAATAALPASHSRSRSANQN